jgi:DNA polymerase III subunit delta'
LSDKATATPTPVTATEPSPPPTLAPWLAASLERLLLQRGHAWLLTGTAGLGQLDLAMAMAASTLCEAQLEGEPYVDPQIKPQMACGVCEACLMIRAKSHPDLAVLMPETLSLALGWPLDEKTQTELDEKKRKPSKQIKIEAVQGLISFAQRTSARGRGLAVVIYPAEAMNHIASNALLKTLEEPAGNARFVLATEDSAALLPTIRSRCQAFTMTTPDAATAVAWLTAQTVGKTAGKTALTSQDAAVWLKAAGGQPQTALDLSAALGKTSAWLGIPALVARGAAPSDYPAALVETAATLVAVLQKLCHDLLCVGQGAQARFFDSANLLAAAPHVDKDATRQAALYKLTGWAQSLNTHVRSAEHTLNAGLMIEALLAEAKQALRA